MFFLPKIIVVLNAYAAPATSCRGVGFLACGAWTRELACPEQQVRGEAGRAVVLEVVPRQGGAW